jgi:hypothetical protein
VGAGAMWNVAGAGLLAAWARAQWPVGIEIRLIERFAAVTESIGWSILPVEKNMHTAQHRAQSTAQLRPLLRI